MGLTLTVQGHFLGTFIYESALWSFFGPLFRDRILDLYLGICFVEFLGTFI